MSCEQEIAEMSYEWNESCPTYEGVMGWPHLWCVLEPNISIHVLKTIQFSATPIQAGAALPWWNDA